MASGCTPSVDASAVQDGMIMTRADRSVFLPPQRLATPRGLEAPLPPVLIFDLDDTLYPEIDFVQSAHRAVAERVWQDLGIDIEPELRRRFAAGQRGDLMSAALVALGVKAPSDYVGSVLVPVYREHAPRIRPHVETAPVLASLRERGHRLALLSDGWAKVQRGKLAALGLEGFFDAVVMTDDLGRNAWKPSPAGFERILATLGIRGDEALYVADNPYKDFAGPHRLGIRTVRIVRPGSEHGEALAPAPIHQPQRMIRALSELLMAAPD